MHCPYCFQAIPDRSRECPRCGSKIPPDATVGGEIKASAMGAGGKWTATTRRIALAAGVAVFLCLCLSFVAVANPRSPFSPLSWLSTEPTPTPLRIRERTFATATTIPVHRVCSRRAGPGPSFCIHLPETWLVVDRASPFWQRELSEMAREYPWAPALLGADPTATAVRIRAAPPDLVNPDAGRVVWLSVGETELVDRALQFDEIAALAREQPTLLAQPLDGLIDEEIESLRLSEREVAGSPATVVAFDSQLTLSVGQIPVRVRLYFLEMGDEPLVAAYIVDETTLAAEPGLLESAIQSLEPQLEE